MSLRSATRDGTTPGHRKERNDARQATALGSSLAISMPSRCCVAAVVARPRRPRSAGGTIVRRDRDRRRLHRPAAHLLRRDVEARGRDGVQALQLAGQGRRRRRRRAPPRSRPASRSSRKDGKTYTFTIKPGFKFSNGKAVTAQSFVDAFNRFANPKMQSTGRPVPRHRPGRAGRDRRQGRDDLGRQGERATSSSFTLTKAVAGLPRPADDAVLPGDRPDARRPDRRERDQPVRVVRPVLLLGRTPNRSITLKRNPNYKGGRAANADTIQVNVGNDIAVAVPERRAGARPTTRPAASRRPSGRTSSQKYGLNKKDGRVQVRPLARRPLRRDEPRSAAVQEQPAAREGRQLGRRPAGVLGPGRLPRTASAPARSCRPGCPATSRRASTR